MGQRDRADQKICQTKEKFLILISLWLASFLVRLSLPAAENQGSAQKSTPLSTGGVLGSTSVDYTWLWSCWFSSQGCLKPSLIDRFSYSKMWFAIPQFLEPDLDGVNFNFLLFADFMILLALCWIDDSFFYTTSSIGFALYNPVRPYKVCNSL